MTITSASLSTFWKGLLRARLAVMLVLWLPLNALAQSAITDPQEWAAKLKAAESIGSLGPNLFGDSTNFYDGTTSFAVTDIDVPGNNSLPVRVGRTLVAEPVETALTPDLFGNWELDVPYISGVFSQTYGWKNQGSSPYARCSGTYQPVSLTDSYSRAWNYWRGNFVSIPGIGKHALLTNYPTGAPRPTDGQTSKYATIDYSQVRCGVQLANPSGQPGFSGEGFLVLGTDGTKYTFNWMTTRSYDGLARKGTNGTDTLSRIEVRLYATRVEDRFGNYVTYTWNGSQLSNITASDGRSISFTYTGLGKIYTASTNGRTWTYSYDSSGFLTGVLLPDGSTWTLSTNWLQLTYNQSQPAPPCDLLRDWYGNLVQTYVFKHPSGAQGEFTVSPVRHGRTQVPKQCSIDPDGGGRIIYGPPILRDNFGLTAKKIYGPGLPTLTWSMSYGPAQGGYTNCGSACPPDTNWVQMTNPDSSSTRFTYGLRYYIDEGKLLRTQTYAANGTLLRDESSSYAINPSSPPYPYAMGTVGALNADAYADTYLTPRTQTTLSQNGDTYSNTVNAFDSFARATSVTRGDSFGLSRTDTTAYYDNTTRWVLGQLKTSTNSSTGLAESSADYDPASDKPQNLYRFGLLQATLSYNTDGTLYTVKDGLSRTATLSGWKRGAPQSILFPDSSTRSVVIDDNGWITGSTDARGYSTGYGHDPAGRLNLLTYPGGDPVNWAQKTVTYIQLTGSELGVAAGSWRARSTEGRLQISTYYDALWRPILIQELDTATSIARYTASAYDYQGHKTFESYPSTSSNPTTGINSTYDALGRLTWKASTDGTMLQTVAYLSGNRRQIGDALNQYTTTSYQAYDQPDYSSPLQIIAPESQTTTIVRDVYGHIQSATQSGNGVTATRSYSYDTYFRLCRQTDPESGSTVWGYDSASQIVWQAKGQSGTGCLSAAPSGATLYQYYDTGRKKLDDYPGTNDDVTYGYDADGHLTSQYSAAAGSYSYSYNHRGLMDGEPGFSIGYFFDSQGHLDHSTMPDNSVRNFAPDAWGRPTKINSFNTDLVSNVQYCPNGALKSYTLGNGLSYSAQLDGRQRLQSQTLTGGSTLQALSYQYTDDNDLKQITDTVYNVDSATLGYDGLHRLKTASGLWGSYTYNYDALNNLSSRTGTNPVSYGYDSATNRLATVTGSVSRSYSYDAAGHPSSDGARSYTWNAADQLTSITGLASYVYDQNGKRLLTNWPNGDVSLDGYDASGTLIVGGRLHNGNMDIVNYISLAGQTLVQLTNGVPTYLHPDLLGSPRLGTTASGSIAWQEHFDPYGLKLNGVNEKIGYTGHTYDNESGLTYAKARFYDPQIGRFLTTDPVHFTGDPFTFNRYSYVNNNPYKYTDPTGMMGCYTGTNLSCAQLAGAASSMNSQLQAMVNAAQRAIIAGYSRQAIVEVAIVAAQVGATTTVGAVMLLTPSTTAGPELDMVAPPMASEAGGDASIEAEKGTRFPDRDLPRDEHGNPIQDTEAQGAHTQLGQKDGRSGRYDQAREFDANGNPVRDIDFTDHGRPSSHPNPHQHDYLPNPTGGTPKRGPTRPLDD